MCEFEEVNLLEHYGESQLSHRHILHLMQEAHHPERTPYRND